MRPFFLLILFLSAAVPAAADTNGIDLAPTDGEIAALAAHEEIEAIRITGTTRLEGRGFAALNKMRLGRS